jgi:surface protein
MKPVKQNINLRIENNTALPQDINILGSIPFLNSANNSNTIYEWDLSGETYFGNITATISISTITNPIPTTYTVTVLGYNTQAVALALNTLNLGVFQVSGNTIYTLNDSYIYGNLTILSTAFISTWDTNNTTPSSSASNEIKLPLVSAGFYNFTVDWGDGTSDLITSWNQPETLHTYATAGTYTIGIVGTIQEWSFGNSIVNDNEKLLSISSWGFLEFGLVSDQNFASCVNLDLSGVTDVPNLSASVIFNSAFNVCTSLTTINRSNEWDTSNIVSMFATFAGCTNFNSDISSWDVSDVVDMSSMFLGCTLFNSNISGWNTALNTSMAFMFSNCSSFNQPIGAWNTSSVTDMQHAFLSATSFNQPLNTWITSSVTNMNTMFQFATAFDQNIGGWDVSLVSNFSFFMFGKSFTNYSSANLDAIYNGWSLLSVQPNLTINFGTIKYTIAGQSGKNVLDFAPNNWAISDGGI